MYNDAFTCACNTDSNFMVEGFLRIAASTAKAKSDTHSQSLIDFGCCEFVGSYPARLGLSLYLS